MGGSLSIDLLPDVDGADSWLWGILGKCSTTELNPQPLLRNSKGDLESVKSLKNEAEIGVREQHPGQEQLEDRFSAFWLRSSVGATGGGDG